MAIKTATVQARIKPDLKKDVDQILGELGISASEVINMLYSLIRIRRGLPFDVSLAKNGDALKSRAELIELLEDQLDLADLLARDKANEKSYTIKEAREILGL